MNEGLKNKKLALFMTRGMSLSEWKKIGILEREIKPYQKISEYFDKVYIFTYGNKIEQSYLIFFSKNVEIVTKPFFLPVIIYSFIFPFIHRKKLKEVDIIKTNQMDGSWSAVISKKLYKSKLVVRCGYEWLQTVEKLNKSFFKRTIALFVERFAYRNADIIILTSEEAKIFIIKKFDISIKIIKIISNYVDTDLFKSLPIEKEKNRIIFIGRLEKEKNLINLFYGLEGVNANLVVIGDGSLKYELEKIAKEKKINAVFKGNISQALIPVELNKSEIFILPSFYEGNPKVLLEAMSCGLACIGTDVQGINTIIKQGENGILSLTDSNSIKLAIVSLFENKQLRDRLGFNARKTIEENNDFSIFIKKELEIYKSL